MGNPCTACDYALVKVTSKGSYLYCAIHHCVVSSPMNPCPYKNQCYDNWR
nr:MAG TPA: hypothetical protein [Caudoviricetes sp.]